MKNVLGMSKFSRNTPLLECINVESISTIYDKHKVYMYRQALMNPLTARVVSQMKQSQSKSHGQSVIQVWNALERNSNIVLSMETNKQIIKWLEEKTREQNRGLVGSIYSILQEWRLAILRKNANCTAYCKYLLKLNLRY